MKHRMGTVVQKEKKPPRNKLGIVRLASNMGLAVEVSDRVCEGNAARNALLARLQVVFSWQALIPYLTKP